MGLKNDLFIVSGKTFLNLFIGDKKTIVAVNSCLDQYFHALIIIFLIYLASVQNLKKCTLWLVRQGVKGVLVVVLPEREE